jgi:O-antigen/teichoic acid export membrane protein
VIGDVRKTILNLASVMGGEVLLRCANFFAVVVIARLYGAEMLGLYAAALAYATVAVMIAENGLQVSSIKEIVSSPGSLHSLVTLLCSLRISLFALLSLVLAAIGWFRQWTAEVWVIGLLVTTRVLLYSYSQLQFAVLKSIDRMRVIAPVQTVNFSILLIGIAATYYYSWSLKLLLWSFIIAQIIEIGLSLRILWSCGIRPAKFPIRDCWDLLRRSTPIGLTYVIAGIMMRADVIVLSGIASRSDVGHFAAAHMGIVLLYSLSWLFGSVLLTDLARLTATREEFDAYVTRWTTLLLSFGVSSALALYFVAPPAVLFLYGPGFAVTARLASTMILAIPFILLNALYLSRAIALGAVHVYLGIYICVAIAALASDVLLARMYGGMGIAITIVVREIAMFLAFKIQAGMSHQPDLTLGEPLTNYQIEETIDI